MMCGVLTTPQDKIGEVMSILGGDPRVARDFLDGLADGKGGKREEVGGKKAKAKPAAKKKAAKPAKKKAAAAAKPAAPAPAAAAPGAKTALNPAAAWPFPTGSRP